MLNTQKTTSESQYQNRKYDPRASKLLGHLGLAPKQRMFRQLVKKLPEHLLDAAGLIDDEVVSQARQVRRQGGTKALFSLSEQKLRNQLTTLVA